MSGLADEFGLGGPAQQKKRSGLAEEFGLGSTSSPTPKQNTSLMGDLGTGLKRGFEQLPGVVTGLADVGVGALTGRRFVDEAADTLGEATGFQPGKWADEAQQEYSPQWQAGAAEIEQAWEEGDALDVAGAYARNPGNVASLVAESLPQMLAGGAIGRGALVAGRAAGLVGVPATAAQAARQAVTAGAVGEGSVVAGSTMDQIDDSVDARKAAAASLGAGVVGGALGGLGGRVAQRMGLVDAETALAGGAARAAADAPGLARRLAGGALTEGVIEELPQSIQEKMWQNFAENKNLMEGVPRAAVEGALAGAALGAGANVMPARKPSEEMGLDPSAGPLSAAAATAVDGAASPVRDATRDALLSGAPVPQPGSGYQPVDLQTAVAQSLFRTEMDEANPGALKFFRRNPDLQTWEEVPEADALAAAQARIEQAQQMGEDPLAPPSLDQLVPQVDMESGEAQVEEVTVPPVFEPGESVIWANKDFDYPVEFLGFESQPGADGRTYARVRVDGREGYVPADELQARPEEQPPLPTVEMDTGPMPVDEVQSTPAAGDPEYEFRVQKNGRPFRGENDVRLRKLFNDLQQAGERPAIVPHEGGWAVAVPKPPVQPAQPLALPAPSSIVVDSQGNARRGPTAPFVEPGAQVRPLGGPGMERQAPARKLDAQAHEAATSPANDLPEPTPAQIEAGNYRKGHIRFAGLDISVENPRGSERRGTRPDGSEWRHTMSDHYGYIRRTEGADGEQVDVYVGPDEASQQVFVVDQVNQQDGSFDEHKAMLGFPDQASAVEAYKSNFDPGWRVGPVRAMSVDEFKAWLNAGDQQAPATQMPAAAEVNAAPATLPDILTMSRKRYLDRMAKAAGVKKGSPGYDQAIARLERQYEGEVDAASASIPFEQYNALNSDSPERVNRQAWEALRQEFGEQSYSRASYRQGRQQKGSRAAQLRFPIARLTGGWRNAPQVRVVQSVKNLPPHLRRRVERDGAFDVEGIYSEGAVYLVADNLQGVKHAAFVLQHEVLGHAGLQGAYGNRLKPILMSIYNNQAQVREQADRLVSRFGYEPSIAVEEVLADMAGEGLLAEQPFWPRLVAVVRSALRSLGLQFNWSENDIQALLANARRYIVNGRRRPGVRAMFSRSGASGRGIELVDEQGRLLAPNGKPSRLNERQWHQVRSSQFKGWFGDWQGLAVQDRLDAMKPLKLRTPESMRGLSEKDRLKVIEAALKGMAREGELLQHDELGEVQMAMSGAKKAASTAADPAKQTVLSSLRESFAHSVYASGAISHQHGQTTAYHKLLAPIDVDGMPLVAVFTVREDANGRKFYNAVTVDRKDEAPVAYPRETALSGQRSTAANTRASASIVSPGDVSNDAQGSLPANTEVGSFVRRPLQRVNPADVSKVTDGNGEPRVLYHGTAEQFTVFDQGRAGRSTGHATAPLGIFLTTDGRMAQGYAEKATDGMPGLANVMPLFASIKNPYRMSIAESQRLDSTDKAIAFRQQLEREGYDGVQLEGSPVWVAFYNTQVKSATNNTGAFDELDPDIRYSRAGQRDTEALRKLGLAGSDARNLLDQVRNLTLGGLQAKLNEWSTRSTEGIFDGMAGIRRAEEAVGITDPDRQGYVSARMASGIADVMHGVLHYAAPEWREGVVSAKAGTRGVLDILGELGPGNLTPWLGWLGGKRGQLLKAQGRENNLSDQDIADLLALGSGKEALFERVYREYAKVNEAVLDLAQEAGLVDQSAREKWLTDYYVPFYRQDEAEGIFTAPRTKRGLSHQTAAIKALKGGTLPTNDLLSNMLAGWTKRIDAAMKNKALLEVVDNLKDSDFLQDESPRYQQVLISRSQIAQQIRKDRKALAMAADLLDLPAGSNVVKVINKLMKPESEGFEKLWTRVAPTDPDIIRVQRDGKNEYYRVTDESLLRGLKFMEGSVFNDPITRIGRTFKRIMTVGVTASPDFILRNFIRDAAHAWVINKDGFTLGKDSITGLRKAIQEDQHYRDLMFAGGSFQGGYVHGADPEASAQIIRRALEKKGFNRRQQDQFMDSLVSTPAKAARMVKQGWQMYRELGDKVENANRLSTYTAALEAGKSRRQAAFEAKDLMDYSLRGNFAAAQWFTDVVPFLNARLQGLYKLGRAVKGDKTLIAKEVAMKGAYIAAFSLLLAGINDDDERYQALQDWDKDMHWHIFLGDQHFRIPKPFELGLVFGTVPERMLHAVTGTQSGGDLAKSVAHGVFETLAFNPVPQFYQPIRELQANRNFFRDAPIEDMSDEGKLPEARYDERTSVIGRALGQITGPTIGISPKQIDHLVQGYTGTLGGYVLGVTSMIVRAFDDAERPDFRAADYPVLKVIYQGDAVHSTKYQAEFYDMLKEADQLHRTIKSYQEEGKVEAAANLLQGSRDKLRHRPALGLVRKQLGNIRNQMDAIYRDTTMDGETKRQRLDALQRQANQIAERVVRAAGADF